MTDEHGMLRNGSIDSVGTAGRELNVASTSPSSSTIASTTTTTTNVTTNATAVATTTTTTTTATTNSVNTNLPNNDGNNNENAVTQNNNNSSSSSSSNNSQNDRKSHSPIDNENGNNADHFVSGGGGGGNCASNGNYSTATGNGSNANSKQPNHSTNYTNSNNGSPLHNPCGGRLQFFKDGKFILELARSKEGDRGWISVPRKTYWPPAALSQNNLNNHKNESSTSLSFSDDNSSIQSSPWQRDHSWKQPSPRKNISKDLNLYYYRPVPIVLNEASKVESKRLRRQPTKRNYVNSVQYAKRNVQTVHLSKIKEENTDANNDKENLVEIKDKTDKDKDGDDIVDSPSVKVDIKSANNDDDDDDDKNDEKMDYKVDDETNSKSNDTITTDNINVENCTRIKRKLLRTSKISNVIEKLIARVSEKPMNVTSTQTGLGIHHFSASSRPNDLFYPHQHVSPRKRILREFEKVSLEDRNSSTQKRSRSKSNASSDYASVSNSKASSGYSIVVAQQTANIACNNKDDNIRIANGSPPRPPANAMDMSDKSFKSSKSLTSSTTTTTSAVAASTTNVLRNSHATNESITSQPISKPISNYSIISLLGHNNSSSNNNDSRSESNNDDRGHSESRGSPRSPMSYNHQIASNSRSTYVPKKKSPTNAANALVNSPTNYRNARSPNSSPSPGLQQNSHHSRYHPASLSSPTSSFHPYLSSSRASPLSSGTLSPTDLYRHRPYRTAGSPSTMSNSSISGLTHQYASLNGSPTAFAASNRYSPSTYSSSTKTSPGSDRQSSQSHSLSSAYNVSNLLPSAYESGGNQPSNAGDTHRYSPNAKQRSSSDWSPARTSASSGRGSPTNYANSSNNSLSTTTIPKKTASIRQKYGSLSPNGFACGNSNENVSSPSSSAKSELNSGKNKYTNDTVSDVKHLTKRPRTPESHKKPTQSQEMYDKELQARYNAEMAAMHHQQIIASALQQQAANPFYHMYAGGNMHGANLPPTMTAAAAAAYMNPLYYHHPASEMFRKTHPTAAMDLLHKNIVPPWIDPYSAAMMPYPPIPGSAASLSDKASLAAAKSQNEAHAMLMSSYSLGRSVPGRDQPTAADIEMWNAAEAKKTPITSSPSSAPSAFRRQPQQFSDCEPISLIKDEPSSDVPLNLSKH